VSSSREAVAKKLPAVRQADVRLGSVSTAEPGRLLVDDRLPGQVCNGAAFIGPDKEPDQVLGHRPPP
jgi:hypothetical protein